MSVYVNWISYMNAYAVYDSESRLIGFSDTVAELKERGYKVEVE